MHTHVPEEEKEEALKRRRRMNATTAISSSSTSASASSSGTRGKALASRRRSSFSFAKGSLGRTSQRIETHKRNHHRRKRNAIATSASSSTSAEKVLPVWLTRQAQLGNVDDDLVIAINSIAIACKQIMSLVKAAPLQGNIGLAGGKNESGDEQKKLDVIANDIFLNAVKQCGRSSVIVTEEEDHPVFSATNVGNGDYVVTFDPIDGSSNIDACVTTGAIFGIYSPGECDIDPTQSAEEIIKNCTENANQSGENLVAAGYCMFSSSCDQ